MTKIRYFAYGSNLDFDRIKDRCPSAQYYKHADAIGYYISFGKKGKDGTGKATMLKGRRQSDIVHGVIYEIDQSEMADLDACEFNYQRDDAFKVISNDGEEIVTTYYISQDEVEIGLLPADWYVSLIIKGAKAHALSPGFIYQLENLITRKTDQ